MNDSKHTRIDASHERFHKLEPAAPSILRARRREVSTAAIRPASQMEVGPLADAACFVVEPSGAIPDIVVRHADDLALHLAERLQEVEQREVAQTEFARQLAEAEAAARAWVTQRDMELTALERSVTLREAEIATQAAALAAAEISGEDDLRQQWAALVERQAELRRRTADLDERDQRLQAEQAALDAACQTQCAERQKSLQQLQADQSQMQRAFAQLDEHRRALDEYRRALDERERQLEQREIALSQAKPSANHDEPNQQLPLDVSLQRAQAARDHRAAAEHRWIAGQLWSRLVGSNLASESELADSLVGLRRQLQRLYRNEREALEQLQAALGSVAQRLQPAAARPRDRSSSEAARRTRPRPVSLAR